MPFNLGPMEMLFIAVVLLLLFGAKRLPELGSGLGKGIREFKRSMRDINEEMQRPDPSNQIQDAASRPQVAPPAAGTPETATQDAEAARRDA
jgi:sec-independent protein translocase protein TatA